MIGIIIGAAGFDTAARRRGTAVAAEPALMGNAHEHRSITEQRNSQDLVGA